MKFLCIKCDEPMTLKQVEGSDNNTYVITFICQRCVNNFAMLTNPIETQLVKSLGDQVRGGTVTHKPMEVIKGQLLTKEEVKDTPLWDEEALVRLNNVPPFARPMAKSGIERYARENGYSRVTLEVMDAARKVYGM